MSRAKLVQAIVQKLVAQSEGKGQKLTQASLDDMIIRHPRKPRVQRPDTDMVSYLPPRKYKETVASGRGGGGVGIVPVGLAALTGVGLGYAADPRRRKRK